MELHDEGRKRMATLMLIHGVSQRKVAEAAQWKSHSYVGRLIRGEVKTLDNDAAVRIAHFFGVGTDDLFVSRSSSESRQSVKRKKAA